MLISRDSSDSGTVATLEAAARHHAARETLAALRLLQQAELRAPADPRVRRALSAIYRSMGRDIEARAEDCAAHALDAGMPLVLFNLATAFFVAGQNNAAAKWYRLALMLDPDLPIAHQNLACVLEAEGNEEAARTHRELAFRQQSVFVEAAASARRRVLVLAASGQGNVPIEPLLPGDVNTRIKWFVEYASLSASADLLPDYDVAFNAVGDPDLGAAIHDTVRGFSRYCKTPLLNLPDRVERTRRDQVQALFDGIAGLEVPPVLRVQSLAGATLGMTRAGLDFPLLLRPAGSHGGEGLHRLERPEDLRDVDFAAAPAWYLSPFQDYRSADGYWRKYRIVFVDRRPYPYHLAISNHWLVHYVTADMLADPSKRAEEHRFLRDPASVLGEAGEAAIRAIGERLDLDYAGVDFACLPDGRLLLFEANATMLIHTEQHPAFAYKNPFVQRILDAFEELLDRSQGN